MKQKMEVRGEGVGERRRPLAGALVGGPMC